MTVRSVGTWHTIPANVSIAAAKMAFTNLDSTLKSRDITLPTEVCLVKVMVFPVVTYDVIVEL